MNPVVAMSVQFEVVATKIFAGGLQNRKCHTLVEGISLAFWQNGRISDVGTIKVAETSETAEQ